MVFQVPHNIFRQQPALEKVSLAQNSIQRIRERSFAGLNSLRLLNISGNSLKQIPVGSFNLPQLVVLDLANNDIEELGPNTFANLQNLQALNISMNSIRQLNSDIFNGLSSLTGLLVNENNLESLPAGIFANLPLMERLDLGGNSLRTFSGDIFGDVDVPIRILHLRFNNLVALDGDAFAHTPRLEYLTIAHNAIASLPDKLLANFQVRKLHMQHNTLEELTPAFYSTLLSAQEILLDHNRLTFLPDVEGEFTNLERMTVEGNPWQCTCLEEIFNMITVHGIQYSSQKTNSFYTGARPLCVVTTADVCIKDVAQVREQEIIETYDAAYSYSSNNRL